MYGTIKCNGQIRYIGRYICRCMYIAESFLCLMQTATYALPYQVLQVYVRIRIILQPATCNSLPVGTLYLPCARYSSRMANSTGISLLSENLETALCVLTCTDCRHGVPTTYCMGGYPSSERCPLPSSSLLSKHNFPNPAYKTICRQCIATRTPSLPNSSGSSTMPRGEDTATSFPGPRMVKHLLCIGSKSIAKQSCRFVSDDNLNSNPLHAR